MTPLVSVIIPTYNYANYITEAINSVLEQDFPKNELEIIVVDDGSTDNTKEQLSSLVQNNKIKYYYQQNQGKASATDKAIQYSTGKYIFNLDADDYFLPGKIKNTVDIFESNETVVHVASPAKQIQQDNSFRIEPVPREITGKILNGSALLKRFMQENMLYGGGSTYAARANALKQIVIPNSIDMFIDEFLVLTILPFGNSFFIHECLSVWRGHGGNYSTRRADNEMQAMKEKRLLASSDALLNYLKNNNFESELINIYFLKNLTNKIAYKELTGEKNIRDIAWYFLQVFFCIRPGWNQIKKYHVLNRLMPLIIFKFLKRKLPKSPERFYPNHEL